MVPAGCRSRYVSSTSPHRRRSRKGEAGPLPEFLGDDEDRESASDDDRPQLDAAE
jgi:hypothetical protein